MPTKTIDRVDLLKKDKRFLFEKLGYVPSDEQADFHFSDARIRQIVGGEQGGKSKSTAMEIVGCQYVDKKPLTWLVGADYEQTAPEFGYIVEAWAELGILKFSTKTVSPGHAISKYGGMVKTLSLASDLRKIGREAPHIIALCEAAQVDYMAFLRLLGRTGPRDALFIMSGTFEGSLGWYPEKAKEWALPNALKARSFCIPTWANRILYPGGRQDPKIIELERELPSELFKERFGATPCPPTGLVFKEFHVTHHVQELTVIPDIPVYLWVDPGYAGAYAVEVVQILGDTVFVVDEIYEQNLVTEEIIQICQHKPWWNQVDPTGVVDIAARQHQGMPAVAEVWLEKAGIYMKSNKVGIVEGIERMRTFLKVNPLTNHPLMVINSTCKGLISELGGAANPFSGQAQVYRYKTNNDGLVFSETPEDKHNHAIKAMIYGIVSRFGHVKRQRSNGPIKSVNFQEDTNRRAEWRIRK